MESLSKAARSLGVVGRPGNLFDCPYVLQGCFNAYDLPNLEYCASMWMLSVKSHLSLLDSVVCSADKLCDGELSCLGHRKKVSVLCLLYKIYHRADHSSHEYLYHFIATNNRRGSTALCELGLVIPHC